MAVTNSNLSLNLPRTLSTLNNAAYQTGQSTAGFFSAIRLVADLYYFF